MKQRKIRSVLALALAVSILFSLPLWATGSARALEDESTLCSLTMHPGGDSWDEDMEKAGIVIDLYKVADARKDAGYDTYNYETEPAFAALEERLTTGRTELDGSAWGELAAEAAKIVFRIETGMKPVKSAAVNTKIEELEWGLYLVVARGEKLTDYVKENVDGQIVTVAQSSEYAYSFFPYLVSLPSTSENLDEDEMNTSQGTWHYDAEGTLKPERASRFGDLEITKTLNGYHTGTGAAFVFDVEAVLDDEVVYSNVVSISFTESGTQTVTLTGVIPAGAVVTVTEVYSGTSYTVVGDSAKTVTVSAEEIASVAFENDYNDTGNNGGSILNSFEFTPGGGWEWTKQ